MAYNDYRNKPNSNQGHKSAGFDKPQATIPTIILDYIKHPNLFDEIAKEVALKISKTKSTQIRNFYDYVLDLNQQSKVKAFSEVLPFVKMLNKLLLAHFVQPGGRLVQQQDSRRGDQGARQQKRLTLTAGEARSALVDDGVQPHFLFAHKLQRAAVDQRLVNLIVGRQRVAHQDVVPHGAKEQTGLLAQQLHVATHVGRVEMIKGNIVQQNAALLRLLHARQKL